MSTGLPAANRPPAWAPQGPACTVPLNNKVPIHKSQEVTQHLQKGIDFNTAGGRFNNQDLTMYTFINELVQKRHNSSAIALELWLFLH